MRNRDLLLRDVVVVVAVVVVVVLILVVDCRGQIELGHASCFVALAKQEVSLQSLNCSIFS